VHTLFRPPRVIFLQRSGEAHTSHRPSTAQIVGYYPPLSTHSSGLTRQNAAQPKTPVVIPENPSPLALQQGTQPRRVRYCASTNNEQSLPCLPSVALAKGGAHPKQTTSKQREDPDPSGNNVEARGRSRLAGESRPVGKQYPSNAKIPTRRGTIFFLFFHLTHTREVCNINN